MTGEEVSHRTREPEAVKAELDAFENRYGVSSVDMHKAFIDATGEFVETPDFRRWDFIYALGCRFDRPSR